MHLLIVADAFFPMRTSAAVMLADLAREFLDQSHSVSIIIPEHNQNDPVAVKIHQGANIFFVKALRTKDLDYLQRTFAEFINPFLMWNRLCSCPEFKKMKVDGIIWYSPTIFWGPLIKRLKSFFRCKAYLILRDIFPDWTLHLGLLNQGLIYTLFNKVTLYQYSQANCIGVQSPNNLTYFLTKNPKLSDKTKVLWNWVGQQDFRIGNIQLANSPLAGKKVGIYAGNIGVAQGLTYFLNISRVITENSEFGIIYVGRGREMRALKKLIMQERLPRILFFDEIDPAEIEALYRQCHFGLLVLDPRHKTHNIPGKFISYVHSRIPTFGSVNAGNDLLEIVNEGLIGILTSDYSTNAIRKNFSLFNEKFLNNSTDEQKYITLEDEFFSVKKACKSILCSLQLSK